MLCVCGRAATEKHHIVKRSKCKALENCELNIKYLCRECHYRIHHANRYDLDLELRTELQQKLERLFVVDFLSRADIKDVLKINDKELNVLLKTLQCVDYKYRKQDVIKVCLGGRYMY